MNNKAHLRPKDFDSNGDIIPMACKEEKGDLVSRKWLTDAIRNRRTYLSYEDAKDVIDLIDNAPAVEYTFEEAFQKTICENKLYCPARPQGKCEKCDYYGFSQAFINGIVEVISKYGITSVEQLSEKLKGGADCMDEDAKQASIPYTYNAPQHDWKCGYPDITSGKKVLNE